MLKTFGVGLAAAGILLAGCSESQKQNAETKASQAASALPSVLDSAGAKASDLKSQGADALESAKATASSLASQAQDQASQAAGQVGDAVENLKIQLTDNVDQAKAELQRLKEAGVYNTDAVKYSEDPVTALKELKDRLDQGLVDLQGQLTEKGKQVLGTN